MVLGPFSLSQQIRVRRDGFHWGGAALQSRDGRMILCGNAAALYVVGIASASRPATALVTWE